MLKELGERFRGIFGQKGRNGKRFPGWTVEECCDVVTLRSLIIRARQGDRLEIDASPILEIGSEIGKTVMRGDERSLEALKNWLTPLCDNEVLSVQEVGEGEEKGLEITGLRTTVESLCGLVKDPLGAKEILVGLQLY